MKVIKLFEQWLYEDELASQTTSDPSPVNQYTISVVPSEAGSTPVNIVATSDSEYKTDRSSTFKVVSSDNQKITAGEIVTISAMGTDKGTYDVIIVSDPPNPENIINYGDAKVTIIKSQAAQPNTK